MRCWNNTGQLALENTSNWWWWWWCKCDVIVWAALQVLDMEPWTAVPITKGVRRGGKEWNGSEDCRAVDTAQPAADE